MTTHEFDTMTTTVPTDDQPQRRGQKLVDRQGWLTAQGAHGWELVSTVTLPSEGATIIVDTMTRWKEWQN